MLRRLKLNSTWRSLHPDFLPYDIAFGKRTVVYGHNGSGKSTLSELLLELSQGDCPTSLEWEDENKGRIKVKAGDAIPTSSIAVFTRKWIDANLSAFLDGSNASAIVTLGEEAIEAKEEQAKLAKTIDRLQGEVEEIASKKIDAEADVEKLVTEVQERVVTELREFDFKHFTKNRYSKPTIKGLLREYAGETPDGAANERALKLLREPAPSSLQDIPAPPSGIADVLEGLHDALAETPTRVAIKQLAENLAAQNWVERGINLHAELDRCLFCAGQIRGERRDQLSRHFDESWLRIRSRAEQLLKAVVSAKNQMLAWSDSLHAEQDLTTEYQPEYEASVNRVQAQVRQRIVVFEAIESALNDKISDPGATPSVPEWSLLATALPSKPLAEVVARHNQFAQDHEEVIEKCKETALNHLIGSSSEDFKEFERQANMLHSKLLAIQEDTRDAKQRLNEVRQAQFTTKAMADTLTSDLARAYGKNHLKITVTEDGKSYACRRQAGPATDLSEGERMTLSLLYFLRRLEDEQAIRGRRDEMIVVIDDPSSSLDRESIFATHQMLKDSLGRFGQYIVFTHDFGLLRLFMNSHKSAWRDSKKKIERNDKDESRFPKVVFLEMRAATHCGERRSHIRKLPDFLVETTSEYVYLFSMIMAGVAEPDDYQSLFLLPNAARRLLEVFASYKAPDRSNFLEQLEDLVRSESGGAFRDVYDFCNRFSHGEGSESVDVLDAHVVHRQIRRCMEFLRAVDEEHYLRMCKAAKVEPTVLS